MEGEEDIKIISFPMRRFENTELAESMSNMKHLFLTIDFMFLTSIFAAAQPQPQLTWGMDTEKIYR